MKKIINQKRYDTETAQERGYWENHYGRNDFYWYAETLYQKKTGEFFLYGTGNAASKYAESCGNNSWCGGAKLIPLEYEEAQQWAEEHLDADKYEEIFGEVPEDDSRTRIALSLPSDAAYMLKGMASRTGRTQSDIVADLIKNRPAPRIRDNRMMDVFTKLGAEEIYHKDLFHDDKKYTYHLEDFQESGEMEKFAEYTIGRFEEDFCCIISIG